jgi:acyl-CoA thioester hydrolase
MEATDDISEITVRVNYSEIDQMGVVYHAWYLVWFDRARTEHLRRTGTSYAELERQGLRMVVGRATVRYRQPARYDDLVTIRCWIREIASRRITFGYAALAAADGRLLVTGETSLLVLDSRLQWARLPAAVAGKLRIVADPVRL